MFGLSTTAMRVKAFIEHHQLYNIKAFIVDDVYKNIEVIDSYPVLSLSEFRLLEDYHKKAVFLCLAWNRLNQDRRNVFEKYSNELRLVNLISPLAVIRGKILGNNIWLGDYSVLEQGSVVCDNVIMDHLCFVGTNSIIEAHSYIAVKAMIAGDSVIGKQSFVGINTTIFDQVQIGEKSIIAGGEIIKRNIEKYSLVKSVDNIQSIRVYKEDEIINKLLANENVR